jgi:hypothetical protein
MVVRDLDFLWSGIGPSEHNAPPAIDPDRVLAGEVVLQFVELIAGRGGQVAKGCWRY